MLDQGEPRSALTRRAFLKGASVTAIGTALGESALSAIADDSKQSSESNVISAGSLTIGLTINGANKSVEIEPRTTLAEALRINLDLTGTKVVCDRGSCSACTVWLDGTPINSCMTLALDARGKKITTIEGLALGDTLHPVQQQFIEHDALQCGFCTPGMIMSCAALLERKTAPTLDDVRAATSGNLCRCGTYPKVFEATLAAASTRNA